MQQSGRMNQQEPAIEVPSTAPPLAHSHAALVEENSRLRQQLEIATANERAVLAR